MEVYLLADADHGVSCIDIPHPLIERARLLDSCIGFDDLLNLPENVTVNLQPSHLVLYLPKHIVPATEGRITSPRFSLVVGLAFAFGHTESPRYALVIIAAAEQKRVARIGVSGNL